MAGGPTLESKELRDKIKNLTKKEIELQDQVEQLKNELQLRT